MPDVKLLGRLVEGQHVHINGREYIIDDVREDVEKSIQITFKVARNN